ncbi:non-specific lipid transfer protein GPI-anchored 14-like [Tasmannia lanceolata]|uniref:non-specific lipid transfer protein GPI-anchored 14-like n=1 Tax=Tasmannia lanceolata TaxID=3420 RepID=UPI004062D962
MAKLSLMCVILVMAMVVTSGTMEEDEKDCADQLTNMASCIPFVSGSAKKPTQQCCDDTMKVKTSKPKCLCVLIKESTDPSMALPVNTTLALQMPSACNIDAKVSDCPSLLKLSPDSPDAKIFKDSNADSTLPATTTPPSSSSSSPSTASSGSGSDSKAASSEGTMLNNVGCGAISTLMVSIAWLLV